MNLMEKNIYSGKFIIFEGLDGSGQSTQAGLLRDFLIKKGYQVVLTKEPTLDSQVGRKIRKILDKKIVVAPARLQRLFIQDRKEHSKGLIEPALKEGRIVISDRYFFSTLAFGVSEGLDLEWLIKINNDFLLPDISFILKVPPEICIRRIEKRGNNIKLFEKKEKLEKVWQTYEILPNKFKNVYIVNGEESIQNVFTEINRIIFSKLL